jgi:flavin reductase (DIM6/NTAB) family NADH-FMN oxidoreductase RutF/rubredoxin
MSENSIKTDGNELNLKSEMNTKAMYRLSYGLFVCTVKDGKKTNGCIINTAIQVASSPNRISIAVNKANYTHDMLKETGRCNVSVISTEAELELFRHFGFQSGRDVDKFALDAIDALSKALNEGAQSKVYEIADNGIPYITAGTNAYFSLKVDKEVDLGSHTLFICEPTFMTVLSDAPSCTYEYYQSDIKPKPQAVGTTPKGETIWRCRICGYEYVGEELPDDFICPICKHGKADFEKIVR